MNRPGPRVKAETWSRAQAAAASRLGALVFCLGVAGCTSDTPAASATIGPDGGTVLGPDGVQLVVPPGALTSEVTFRIARSSAGAPVLPPHLPADTAPPIYEVTPHGQEFLLPVQVRIPVRGASDPATLLAAAADPGGTWAVVPATLADGVGAIERLSLSWFVIGFPGNGWFCSPAEPYGCVNARISAPALSAPAGVLEAIGINDVRVVQAATLVVSFDLDAPRPCAVGSTVDISRTLSGGLGSRTTRTTASVSLQGGSDPLRASGTFSLPVPLDASSNGHLSLYFNYACHVSGIGAYGRYAYATAQFYVDIAGTPAITQQPQATSVASGETASFTVLAGAPDALEISWERSDDGGITWNPAGSGAAIAGGSTLALLATLSDDGARFRARVCSVRTLKNCLSSAPAQLTVRLPDVVPVFVVQPASQTVALGSPATWTASATGRPAPSVRWQVASGAGAFADVAGEPACVTVPAPSSGDRTDATCQIATTPLTSSGQRYRAVASSLAAPGGVPSAEATLTVSAGAVGPTITQQPAPQRAFVGGSASFAVAATGTAPLFHAWRANGLALPPNGGTFTRGGCLGTSSPASLSTVTLTGVNAACDGLSVDVQVANAAATVTSAAVTLAVVPATRSLSLLAGEIGGPGVLDETGARARLSAPDLGALAVASSGTAYFLDPFAGTIRKVSDGGVVTSLPVVAGASPTSLAADAAGRVYVTEVGNVLRVSQLNPDGSRTAIAGGSGSGQQDGPGAQATFTGPHGLASGPSGELYVVDSDFVLNARVRKISAAGEVSTLHDFGTPIPSVGLLAVTPGGELYGIGVGPLANTVVHITSAGPTVVAGSPTQLGTEDGTGAAARFSSPRTIAADASGTLLVVDSDSNGKRIRQVTPGGAVTSVSGATGSYLGPGVDGPPATARWSSPSAIALAPGGSFLVGDVATLRWLSTSFVVSTFVGKNLDPVAVDGTGGAARFTSLGDLAVDAAGNAIVTGAGGVRQVTPVGAASTLVGTAGLRWVARDPTGYLVAASPSAIYRLAPGGARTLLAGSPTTTGTLDGPGSSALLDCSQGLAVDAAGNVFVSQSSNHLIRRIAPDGTVSTYAGSPGQQGALDGPRLGATFNQPAGLAIDGSGNLYVADSANQVIRRISPAGDVSTIAGLAQHAGSDDGSGAAARFAYPRLLALDPAGALIIADTANFTLRRMTPAGGVTTVLGHLGKRAVVLGSDPQLNLVSGLAVRADGTVLLTSEGAVLEATLP